MTLVLFALVTLAVVGHVGLTRANTSSKEEMMITKQMNSSRKDIGDVVKKLPNVRRMTIKVSTGDKLFIAFGIRKRKRKAHLSFDCYKNRALNRYIEHQINRLNHIEDPVKFGRISKFLMSKSLAFYICCLHHVYPHGYRDIPFHKVISMRKRYSEFFERKEGYKFKIVEIPKSNGKIRTLSVPSPVGRIYLHMLYIFMFKFIQIRGLIHPDQHGFIPGRGTLSAWKKILQDVIYADNIYEFDLKGFFPNLSLKGLRTLMSDLDFPEYIIDEVMRINGVKALDYHSAPGGVKANKKLPSHLIDFAGPIINGKSKPIIGEGECGQSHALITSEETTRGFKLGGRNISFGPMITNDLPKGVGESGSSLHSSKESRLPDWTSLSISEFGVQQGSAISPILSTICLNETLFCQPNHTLMYADDGILYGNNNKDPKLNYQSHLLNITFSPDKSGGVKHNNIWIKPLKFLGLTYDPFEDCLHASTRNGSLLKYDKHDLVKLFNEREGQFSNGLGDNNSRYHKLGKVKTKDNGEQLFRSKLFGFIQARLYLGDGNLDKLDQDFTLSYKPNSYVDKHIHLNLTLHNSSSFAIHELAAILRKKGL